MSDKIDMTPELTLDPTGAAQAAQAETVLRTPEAPTLTLEPTLGNRVLHWQGARPFGGFCLYLSLSALHHCRSAAPDPQANPVFILQGPALAGFFVSFCPAEQTKRP